MTTALSYMKLECDTPKAASAPVLSKKEKKAQEKQKKIAGLIKDKEAIQAESSRLLGILFVDPKAAEDKNRRLEGFEAAMKKIDKALRKLQG